MRDYKGRLDDAVIQQSSGAPSMRVSVGSPFHKARIWEGGRIAEKEESELCPAHGEDFHRGRYYWQGKWAHKKQNQGRGHMFRGFV